MEMATYSFRILLLTVLVCKSLGQSSYSSSSYSSSWQSSDGSSEEETQVDVNSLPRSSAFILGDPHVRLYDANSYITCSAEGLQPYVVNDYIEFFGNNSIAMDGFDGTYITSIFLTIMNQNGNDIAVYAAADSSLPSSFVGGMTSIDDDSGLAEIITLIEDRLVLIRSQTTGLAFVVYRDQHAYGVAVRMADALWDDTQGILSEGCDGYVINRESTINGKRRKRSTACDSTSEAYSELCEYDFAVTGDSDAGGAYSEADNMADQAEEQDDYLTLNESRDGASTLRISLILFLAALTLGFL